MDVLLEEARDGGVMAKVDGFICFFDRWSIKRGVLRRAKIGQQVDVMFTGKNRRSTVLFMAPVSRESGQRLIKHGGFQLMGRGMDLEVMAPSSLNGPILKGDVPIPAVDGESRMRTPKPGICWAIPTKHRLAKWKCIGVENPWNLLGLPTEMP